MQEPCSEQCGDLTSRSRFPERASRALRWAAVLLAALYVGFSVLQMSARLAYPYQLEYGEGPVLHCAQAIAQGKIPYAASPTLPWVPHLYGPVFPALWAALLRVAPPGFWWPGRLVAVAGLWLAAGCLILLVQRLSGQWGAALVTAGVFLWFPVTRNWTADARVDTLAVGLALAGFTTFVLGSPRTRVWGTLLFVLAVGTKQTMLAAPVAAYAALYWQGERRNAALHLALFLGLILAAGAALQGASHGGFLRDTVVANLNKWSWNAAHHAFRDFLKDAPLLLGVALALAVLALADRKYRALGLYQLLALAVAATVGKVGAEPIYFLETTAVAAVFLGLGFASSSQIRVPFLRGATLLPVLVLVQLVSMWIPPTLRQSCSPDHADVRLAQLVRAQPGEVLSEYMGAVVQAGKTLWTDPFVTTQMAEAGRWDQEPLLQMIRERRFGLVVMVKRQGSNLTGNWWWHDRWTPEEARAILQNYRVREVLGGSVASDSDWGLVVLEPDVPPAPGDTSAAYLGGPSGESHGRPPGKGG